MSDNRRTLSRLRAVDFEPLHVAPDAVRLDTPEQGSWTPREPFVDGDNRPVILLNLLLAQR